LFGNGNSIKQVFTGVLVPFGSEFQTVVEQGEVDTHVVAFLLFPRKVVVYESGNGRTGDGRVAKAISHVITCHYSLIHVFTNVFVTELAIAGTYLEHVDNVSVEGEERLLVETPSHRNRGEGAPTDILGQAGTAVAAHGCREQITLVVVVVDTPDVG